MVVAGSDRDALLFGASVSGASVGTVTITSKGGATVIANTSVASLTATGTGGNLAMTLVSRPSQPGSE